MKVLFAVVASLIATAVSARIIGECPRDPGDAALSGIAYAGDGVYWAADDNGYVVKGKIELDPGSGKPLGWKRLDRFECAGVKDPEGIVYDRLDGTLWVSDEHKSRIWHVDPKSKAVLGRVLVPAIYKSVEDNRGFESLAIGNDGLVLWTANEGPLACDEGTDYLRLQRFMRASVTNEWLAAGQWAYRMEHCLEGKNKAKSRNGLSELCVMPDGTLLALEREKFKKGQPKFRMRLFKVEVAGATDVFNIDSLRSAEITPVKKSAVCEMATGNAMYEAICVGPKLPDGSDSYVLVSDGDNDCDEKVLVMALP